MMKFLKYTLGFMVSAICFVVLGFIAYETAGMVINHRETTIQTERLEETIKQEISDAKIIDSYKETGNTSGTGNHVDMVSVILLQSDEEYEEIEIKLKERYQLDEWSFFVKKTDDMAEYLEEIGVAEEYREKMIAYETNKCYMVYLCQSAPFVDNIEGH